MNTLLLKKSDISKASKIIRNSGVVAFPTETVYGLGANALDENAVKKIFEAKGRPADNPLIIHIAEKSDIEKYAKNIPPLAYTFIEKFWPGALTLVLEKQDLIPDITTAGLATVCLRMPDHPIALELIKLSGVPLAGPSANTSTRPSPTSSEHVMDDMDGRIDAVIEGEVSTIGIESTVLDLTVAPPVILRHGGVTREMLEEYTEISEKIDGKIAKSPGMKYRHYAPNVDIIVVEKYERENIIERIEEGENIGYMGLSSVISSEDPKGEAEKSFGDDTRFLHSIRHRTRRIPVEMTIKNVFLFPSLELFSKNLFDIFRKSEKLGLEKLYIENLEELGLGRGIMNRVRKAASKK